MQPTAQKNWMGDKKFLVVSLSVLGLLAIVSAVLSYVAYTIYNKKRPPEVVEARFQEKLPPGWQVDYWKQIPDRVIEVRLVYKTPHEERYGFIVWNFPEFGDSVYVKIFPEKAPPDGTDLRDQWLISVHVDKDKFKVQDDKTRNKDEEERLKSLSRQIAKIFHDAIY